MIIRAIEIPIRNGAYPEETLRSRQLRQLLQLKGRAALFCTWHESRRLEAWTTYCRPTPEFLRASQVFDADWFWLPLVRDHSLASWRLADPDDPVRLHALLP
jgi:hypothetical protein